MPEAHEEKPKIFRVLRTLRGFVIESAAKEEASDGVE
jgi:hypothetical protein